MKLRRQVQHICRSRAHTEFNALAGYQTWEKKKKKVVTMKLP